MDKKSNMKKAMYEMFGVGGDGSEAASTAPAQVKSASVEVKSAPGAEKKSVDHAPVKTPEARPAASFLAPGTVFEGSFRAKGDIEIAGELKGDVASEGSVLLRSNLQSNITAGSVKLTGCTLIGDITANGPVNAAVQDRARRHGDRAGDNTAAHARVSIHLGVAADADIAVDLAGAQQRLRRDVARDLGILADGDGAA